MTYPNFANKRIGVEFEKYGLKLENFNVIGINVQENDPSFIRLKEAKDLAARLKITGKDVYQMERSFNVLENAASNEGGGACQLRRWNWNGTKYR